MHCSTLVTLKLLTSVSFKMPSSKSKKLDEWNSSQKKPTLVSSMIASTLSLFCSLYSFTRSMTFWWDAWSPWDMFIRATFMPASANFHIISLVLVDGPMVQTIFVFLITFGLGHNPFGTSPTCWMLFRCWNCSSSYSQKSPIPDNLLKNYENV